MSGPPPDTSSETAVFTFTGTDNFTPPNGLIFECRLDPPPDPVVPPEPPDLEPPEPGPPDIDTPHEPANWGECASPLTYQFLEPGDHHFEVRAIDHADNKDATPATYDWNINPGAPDGDLGPDQVAPDTRLAAAPALDHDEQDRDVPLLRQRQHDAGPEPRVPVPRPRSPGTCCPRTRTSTRCGRRWGPCVTPKSSRTSPTAATGSRSRAVDRAGNADSTPAAHRWWIQPPPPDRSTRRRRSTPART